MDFTVFAPATWDTFGEAVDFIELPFDLAKVARLIVSLVFVYLIEVFMTIDFASEFNTVIRNLSLLFERYDSYNLLIQLTSSIMQTLNWSQICLVNFMMLRYHWIRKVLPIVAPNRTFIRCPTTEAMH